jgi:FlaA1/EpsC-like NDP-sugar epimerase
MDRHASASPGVRHGGGRFFYRSWKDGHLVSFRKLGAQPVLVLGAGHAASLLLRELARGGDWRVVGLLDDDPMKKGHMMSGVPVLGPITELPRHARERDVRRVIIALPSASPARRRHVVENAAAAGLSVFTVPALEDIMMGRVAVSRVRPVELDDLLGRGRVTLDDEGLSDGREL